MITLFSIPKPFEGNINIIQRNAVKSWLALGAEAEIILFGNDKGVKETAQEFGIKHIPDIKTNEFNTPFLNWAWTKAQKIAQNNILVYANTDIIFLSDLISGIKEFQRQKDKLSNDLFLINGRRIDLEVKEEIDFNDFGWEQELKARILKEGKPHNYSGIDYLVFPKDLPHNMPDFAVGRIGWDNWLIYSMRKKKIPVVDATRVITAVHQNHDFSHSKFADEKRKRVEGPETKKSLKLAGGLVNMLTIRESSWLLRKQGLEKNKSLFSRLALFYPWRLVLALKRKIQNAKIFK